MSDPVLSVKGLSTHFFTRAGVVKAVNGVSFSLDRGDALGVVGESGSGKSTIGKAILHLVPPTSGGIAVADEDISVLTKARERVLRKTAQMISKRTDGIHSYSAP